MKNRRLSFFSLLLFIFFCACEEADMNAENCDLEDRICTEEFVTITLQVTDTESNPVLFDEFYTFFNSRKKIELSQTEFQKERGIYPVVSDLQLEELNKEGTTVIFVGEIGGRNRVEHQMVVGHDCCHVQLIDGEDEIVMEDL